MGWQAISKRLGVRKNRLTHVKSVQADGPFTLVFTSAASADLVCSAERTRSGQREEEQIKGAVVAYK